MAVLSKVMPINPEISNRFASPTLVNRAGAIGRDRTRA
jgi:hypothetical protein